MAEMTIAEVPKSGLAMTGLAGILAPAGGAAQAGVVALDAPEDGAFSLALQQALMAIAAGGGIRPFFEMPGANAVDGQAAALDNEVALENLAAGEIPQGLLEAITAVQHAEVFADGAANGPSEHAEDAGTAVKSLLGYLAGIVAPLLSGTVQPAQAQARPAQAQEGQSGAVASGMQSVSEAPPQAGGSSMAVAPAMPVTTAVTNEAAAQSEPVPLRPAVQEAPKASGAIPVAAESASAPAAPVAAAQEASEVAAAPLGSAEVQATAVPAAPEVAPDGGGAADGVSADASRGEAPAPGVVSQAVDEVVTASAPAGEIATEPASTDSVRVSRRHDARGKTMPETTRADAVRSDAVQDAREGVTNAPVASVQAASQAAAADTGAGRPVQAAVSSEAEKDALDAVESAPAEPRDRVAEGQAVRQNQGARADQDRVISRIAAAIAQNQASGRTTVRIRLYPPEMGTVRVEVSSVRGAVSARIEASSQATHEVLQSNIAALRAELRDAGIEVREMQVRYREGASAFGAQDQQSRRGAQEQPRHSGRARGLERAVEVEEAASYSEAPVNGRVNILV